MKKYHLKITKNAFEDMEKIRSYIAEDLKSPLTARLQYARIKKAILSLEVFPERCPVTEKLSIGITGIRRLFVDNYLIFYVVENKSVYILNVKYQGQQL